MANLRHAVCPECGKTVTYWPYNVPLYTQHARSGTQRDCGFEPASDRVELAEGRLREAREHGLRHAEATRALGRPQSFVAKIEAGHRRVNVIELQDLVRRYRKPLAVFVQ